MARVYNFSAGPSMQPVAVLEKAKNELMEYGQSGQSVMEMSHRSSDFETILNETTQRLYRVLNIPRNYKVAYLHGGATMQFAMVPLNLMKTGEADYWVTGNFSKLAAKEAKKFGKISIVADSADRNFTYIPDVKSVKVSDNASYVHICQNNTIFGTRFKDLPETGSVPLVADLSSCILSEPVDVSKYGLIYFGVQKNVAPSGLAIVIIREDLISEAADNVPSLLSYKTMLDADSMPNTPNCWSMYMTGLTLEWIEALGGLEVMKKQNEEKAAILYNYLDGQDFYTAPVEKDYRSMMNVTFTAPNAELDKAFCAGSKAHNIVNIKGHRLVGGMRASIYNAMPKEGVVALVDYMKAFAAKNGGNK